MTAPAPPPGFVTVTRNAETLYAAQLANSDAMFSALKVCNSGGYYGHVGVDSNGQWTLYLVDPKTNITATGSLNDWCVIANNAVATIVPAATAGNLYSVAPS